MTQENLQPHKQTPLPSVRVLLDTMSADLQSYLNSHAIQEPLVVGIRSAGVYVAKELHQRLQTLGLKTPMSELNINFYRDDFNRIGLPQPQLKPSNLPTFGIEDRHIVLVDDVLHTGRTVRAAMNELFDYGRPASIILVVLIARSGRELPIEAQITGLQLDADNDQRIKLSETQAPQTPEIIFVKKSG